MLPFVLGFIIFVLCALALFILLARFSLLPKGTFKTHEITVGRGSPARDAGFDDVPSPSDMQEEEIITLPESALRKEDDENGAG